MVEPGKLEVSHTASIAQFFSGTNSLSHFFFGGCPFPKMVQAPKKGPLFFVWVTEQLNFQKPKRPSP